MFDRLDATYTSSIWFISLHACIYTYLGASAMHASVCMVLPQLYAFKYNREKSIILYYTSVLIPCKYHHLFFNELLD